MENLKLLFVLIVLLLFLIFRFLFFYQNQPQFKAGQDLEFETTLLSDPKVTSRSQQFSANPNGSDRIWVTILRFPEFHYGQTLRVSGSIQMQTQEEISRQKGQLPTKEKPVMTMFFPKVELVKKEKNLLLVPIEPGLALTSFIRQRVTSLFEQTLPANSSALLLGIVFGIREGMEKSFSDNLRTTGVVHVVAASGMNVTMVGGFLAGVFKIFLRRQLALFLTLFGLMFYALLTGFDPPIVRATIMGSLVLFAQILGRQSLALFGLFLAGYSMLMLSPRLLFDVGFQLSLLSTLGLLLGKPLLDQKLTSKSMPGFLISEDVKTTISAQVATLPILLANFNTYSLWSVLVNGLVLWTVPVLMVGGGVGALVGIVIEPLGKALLYFTLPFLLFFESVVGIFSNLSGLIQIQSFPWQLVIGYYLFLAAGLLVFKINTTKSIKE